MIASSLPSESSSSEMGDNHIIPPYNAGAPVPRTLVLCFDGTGDEFDSDNSNVVKFFSLLERDDLSKQMVYYQAGIGTYTSPQLVTPVGQAISKILDKMFAWNLNAHVIAGYEFLMQNYEMGDKICLFGFSRGAYTARALAGMLHKVGLLPPCNHQQVPFAYKMYKRTDEIGWKHSREFKAHFSIAVDIDFIGVWDTVCSVGLIPRRLPFTASNKAIRVFRHALSLDERRAKFEVNHCHYHTVDSTRDLTTVVDNRELTTATGTTVATTPAGTVKNADIAAEKTTEIGTNKSWWKQATKPFHAIHRFMSKKKDLQLIRDEEKFNETQSKLNTDVREVWFAGCHSDVGGGSELNEKAHSLARISLRWMICEIFRTGTGIRFRTELLKEIGLNPDSLQQQAELKVVEQEEREDVKSKIHDQLRIRPWWWILEIVPSRRRNSKKWWKYTPNLGRGRTVLPAPGAEEFYIHRTVRMREEENDLVGGRYKPKATWGRLKPIYTN
ncbi:hypothetical protein V8D89_006412 [Ganoderma adspersum]